MTPLKVGLVCDMLEEQWPSMDLVADSLARGLRAGDLGIDPVTLRPALRRRFTLWAGASGHARAGMLDRMINRHCDYPRWLSRQGALDVYHVIDHSYAHLVERLPRARTVVTCHDLDAFRCVLSPREERRSPPMRALARRSLRGLQAAARVVCVSEAVRAELLAFDLVPPERVLVVPNGVDAVFSPHAAAAADREAERLLGVRRPGEIVVLSVGSTIPRKRLDVLLRAFATILDRMPSARLVRIGRLSPSQRSLASDLGVLGKTVEIGFLEPAVLAAMYRRAGVLLMPSDREGFGLPVIEALASGVPVVASDLRVLRETGGDAATYCPPGDAGAFADAAVAVLSAPHGERRSLGLEHAARFSWAAYAARMAAIYHDLP